MSTAFAPARPAAGDAAGIRGCGSGAARLDWTGQTAAVLAMGALTYATIEAGADGFGAPRALLAFAVAVVAAGVFLASQARGSHPMVPLWLLRVRTMAISAIVGFALNVAGVASLLLLKPARQPRQRPHPARGTGAPVTTPAANGG